jgi:diguanylate cyclase (GGDEF)-like protein
MPGEDPAELCKLIRQEIQEKGPEAKDTFIILIATKREEFDLNRGLSAGADDYLIKPFNFPELKVRLQIAERVIELEDSCFKLSSFDDLTKLLKRDKILEKLDEELNRGWRDNLPTGVLMIDIDHFKKINDVHGHIAGDKVLAEVAARLKASIHPDNLAGRYGGDEMFVILRSCGLNDVKIVAERVRDAVSKEPVVTEVSSLEVTISLGGTSSSNEVRASANSLVQTSDNALLMAKEKGRDNSVIIKLPSVEEK